MDKLIVLTPENVLTLVDGQDVLVPLPGTGFPIRCTVHTLDWNAIYFETRRSRIGQGETPPPSEKLLGWVWREWHEVVRIQARATPQRHVDHCGFRREAFAEALRKGNYYFD